MKQLDNQNIFHYGVPGMHWGSSLGSAQRYKTTRRSGVSKDVARKKIVNENLSTTKTVNDHATNITRESGKILKTVHDIKSTKNREDISKMTDTDLKAKVARMNLEQQYNNLSSNQISKGQAYARSALDVGGSVLAVGGSALGIALAIKQLKGV